MGAPEKSQANSSSMQRVKVYRLTDDGKWDDQGTGHVTVDYIERSEELGLFVYDEEDHETLLLHRISGEDIYRKQEDTIISWRDPEFSAEVALSFQETTGCSYIWDSICNVQRTMNFNSLNNETFHGSNSELRELPTVELSTLPLILKTLAESGLADQMRLTELILNDQDFFRKLMDLFRISEDLDNIDGLHMIHKIVRGIILLNSPQIFEKIFGDDLMMDIIGCLEYDPEVPNVQHHRNFLKEHVVFKEAIPIKDHLVLSKIHQTYRVGYLKDVVLARILDEATVANLNSIIHSNNALVVSLLKDDNTFIHELFARLKSPSISAESRKNLVYFVHEFCSLSKSLQMVQQLRLFRDLMNEGIFDIITDALQSQDKKLVLTGTDILILFLNQDPNLLCSYVVRQEGVTLLGLLVKGMITDFGEDMHCQFLEILRSLLDSFTLSGTQVTAPRDTIIEIFYDKHLSQLVDVIVASCPSGSGERVESQTVVKPEILSNICELLCFCVLHHPYRIKCNFLLSNVIDKVLLLTRRREKYLVVAAVRFIRATLTRSDEHLVNHFVRNNLFKPIVDAFVQNGNRYNLLNSAILDLFEFIRKSAQIQENMKSLLKYLVDSFWDKLVKFEYLASIHSLKLKYEQCSETCGAKTTVADSEPRKRTDERALEKEEEDYFNEDSDEEDTASASMPNNPPKVLAQPALSNGVTVAQTPKSPKPVGLVDYADDEDDEDYKPPPRKQPEKDEEEGKIVFKRKPGWKDKDPEHMKKKRMIRAAKLREVFFGNLSHNNANNKTPIAAAKSNSLSDDSEPDKTVVPKQSQTKEEEEEEEEKVKEEERGCSDSSNVGPSETSESSSSLLSSAPPETLPEECAKVVVPPKSSPEMAVNGS